MYALHVYANSSKNQDNNLIFVPGGQILACKHKILSNLYTWNTILQYTHNEIGKLKVMWKNIIVKII